MKSHPCYNEILACLNVWRTLTACFDLSTSCNSWHVSKNGTLNRPIHSFVFLSTATFFRASKCFICIYTFFTCLSLVRRLRGRRQRWEFSVKLMSDYICRPNWLLSEPWLSQVVYFHYFDYNLSTCGLPLMLSDK